MFLTFSLLDFPQFGFHLLVIFPLSCLELFCSFPSTVCIFIDFFKELTSFLFQVLSHTHTGCSTCASTMLEYSGPAVVGLPGSSGDSVLAATVLLHWHVGLETVDADIWSCRWVCVLFLGFCFGSVS